MKQDEFERGPNLLSTHGAAVMVGRDKNEVQIRIVCGSEDEAKRIIANFREEIKTRGQAIMVFGGTLDEIPKQ
jgi:hypothetical protein